MSNKSFGKIELHHDYIDEKIDEMADLCEIWVKNRTKGRRSNAVAIAIKMIADELVNPVEAINPQAPAGECDYPDCNCPFDASADPDSCAKGLKKRT